jgi:hypothetical protein
MFNFYLRYNQLTLLQRGFDPSRDGFHRYHQSACYGGAKFKRGDDPISFEGFLRMEVTDDETDASLFIPPPKFGHACLNPIYCPTRRCLACPYKETVKKPTMCFLKDSWQEILPRTSRKAILYRMLKEESVEHVVNMLLGSDVCGLETETQRWVAELFQNA